MLILAALLLLTICLVRAVIALLDEAAPVLRIERVAAADPRDPSLLAVRSFRGPPSAIAPR